mmetsp:Transcript_2276/g.4394  ORF Transcript_2276/g.4394 Transcript_2276/m.4394 type:complete len:411 (+) Transcript_2276:224-1456(+)
MPGMNGAVARMNKGCTCAAVWAILAWLVIVFSNYGAISALHVPHGTTWFLVPYYALYATNPRAKPSKGVVKFSAREFSRVCCEYGPTFFKYGPRGEIGVYDYKIALEQFKKSGEPVATVYTCVFDMKSFLLDFFLPLPVDRRVVLVTGQEDCGPVEIFGLGTRDFCDVGANDVVSLETFLSDKRLRVWFTQNYDVKGCRKVAEFSEGCIDPQYGVLLEKIRMIPIGMDYHTIAEKRFEKTSWSSEVVSPGDQEAELTSISKGRWIDRPQKVFSSFAVSKEKKDRLVLAAQVASNEHCILSPGRMSREKTWEAHNGAAFSFSPQGRGIDTHRIYETLNLNTVPIVRSSPLDQLYKKLPIIILESWEMFNCSLIPQWKAEIIERFSEDPFKNPFTQQQLSLEYWVDQVNNEK